MAKYPPRPDTEDPKELGFERQNCMIRWLSPRELVQSGVRAALSGIFGAYADKRELQGALPPPKRISYAKHIGELWIDFVADVGDGFNSTYTIATQLAKPTLDVRLPKPLTRGQILVMGGDQVYPTPSLENYQNRTLGPYRAALPYTECKQPNNHHDECNHPDLYAIPGNHDWYDGLTSFMRVFCTGEWIGGWRTPQTRSYFALKLPHRWWLWGIDVQLESYIDLPQFRYFKQVGAQLTVGASIILCSALPSWVHAQEEEEKEAYVTLDYFERNVIRDRGASVRLALTGDAHHYARYEHTTEGSQKITVGGGGAYLSATHRLPEKLELPPSKSKDPGKSTLQATYELAECYPSKATSKRRRWRIASLPFKNWSFSALIGAVYLLYAWTIQTQLRGPKERFLDFMTRVKVGELADGIGRSPLALLLSAAIVFGMMGFTKSKRWEKRGFGVLHGLLHVGLALATIRLAAAAAFALPLDSEPAFRIGFDALVVVGGGLLGSWLMAIYLLLADMVGCNTNELFAAQRIRDHKNFLRMRLGPDGVLTLYPIKVKRIPCRWRLRQDEPQVGKPDYPWFECTDRRGPPQPELIEPPVRVEPAAPPLTLDLRVPLGADQGGGRGT